MNLGILCEALVIGMIGGNNTDISEIMYVQAGKGEIGSKTRFLRTDFETSIGV